MGNNKILIINQVFWPDKHNTARHISELAKELSLRGWDVSALISNRTIFDYKKKVVPKKGVWEGVKYKRVYVPPFNPRKNTQRLLSAFWLVFTWIFYIPFWGQYDAVLLGTNPPFAYLIIPFVRLFHRKTKILLWGFDLYPEAIMVAGGSLWKFLGAIIKPLTKFCYNKVDVMVDIGPCMREKLRKYHHPAREITLTPWSFVEPKHMLMPHTKTREKLFGNAKLTLLYSGTIGKAHEFDNFLLLVRELNKRKASVGFCFAGFGNGMEQLKRKINNEESNISFAGFVDTDEELEQRLSSADINLISLKEEWTGISVPSKFFGAMASGKMILFSGSKSSSLSIWLKQYNLGFHLTKDNYLRVADMLEDLTKNPVKIDVMKNNAFKIYQKKFSKKIVCDSWSKLLKEAIQNFNKSEK